MINETGTWLNHHNLTTKFYCLPANTASIDSSIRPRL